MVDSDHYGKSGFSETGSIVNERSLWTRAESKLFHYRSAGPFLWLKGNEDQTPICVPKELIHVLSTELAGRPRTQLTLTTALSNSRQHIRSSDIPARFKPTAAVLCASVAFSLHVDHEASIIEQYTTRNSSIYKRLNTALDLTTWFEIPRTSILILTALMGILISTSDFIPYASMINSIFFAASYLPWYVILFFALFLLPQYVRAAADDYVIEFDFTFLLFVCSVTLLCYAYRRKKPTPKVPLLSAGPKVPVDSLTYIPYTEIYGVNTSIDLPDKLQPFSKIRAPRDLLHQHSLRPVLCIMGIVSTLYTPYSHCSNWHNENAFLRTRILRSIPEQEFDYIDDLEKHVFTYFTDIFPNIPDPFHLASSSSFSFWSSRFPRAVQRILILAYETYRNGDYVNWFNVYRHTAFVKVEKASKDGKPRGIQSANPLLNSLTGPEVYEFSQRIQTVWTVSHYLTYSPGNDQLDHGLWLELRGDLESLWADSEDYAVFDTTMRYRLQCLGISIMYLFGVSLPTIFVLRSNAAKTYGKTRKGGSYDGESSVRSGDSTTTTLNTVVNGCVKSFSITKSSGILPPQLNVPPASQPYSAIIGGDDSEVLRRKCYPPLDPHWELGLGLLPEYEPPCHPLQCTFLSALFVPITCDGRPTYMLMPKPGRLLTRFGFALIPPKPKLFLSYVRGSALGLKTYLDFPIIGPFLSQHIEITRSRPALYTSNFMSLNAKRVEQHVVTANEHTYDWFCMRYSIDRQFIHDFATFMATITQLPANIPPYYIAPFQLVDVGPIPIPVDNHDHRSFMSDSRPANN